MKQNIATVLNNISKAKYDVPELEFIKIPSDYGDCIVVELKYAHKNDRTMVIRGIADEPDQVRHQDVQGKLYPLDDLPRLAFSKFLEYSPKIYNLMGVIKLCKALNISIGDLHKIRLQPKWAYIEFTAAGDRLVGMKIGISGYIQAFDLENETEELYHLTQFVRKQDTSINKVVTAAARFLKDINYFRGSEEE